MLSSRKLALTLAFTVLVVGAFGVSCRGFFPKPTLTAVGITPANQTITDVAPNNTKQFSAVGTFDNGNSGPTSVTWSSDASSTVASIDTNSGLATAVGVGTATITATSTILPTISGTTQLTVVPGNVTSITVTPSHVDTQTNSTFHLQAKDQGGNDISGSVTWTFTVHGTFTVESGMTQGTPDTLGQVFTVGTLTPTGAPVNLDAVATLTVGGTTITSNKVTVNVTS
jgi:trimeric autotransporter adhesin